MTVMKMLCARTQMEVMNVNARMVSLVMEQYVQVNYVMSLHIKVKPAKLCDAKLITKLDQ